MNTQERKRLSPGAGIYLYIRAERWGFFTKIFLLPFTFILTAAAIYGYSGKYQFEETGVTYLAILSTLFSTVVVFYTLLISVPAERKEVLRKNEIDIKYANQVLEIFNSLNLDKMTDGDKVEAILCEIQNQWKKTPLGTHMNVKIFHFLKAYVEKTGAKIKEKTKTIELPDEILKKLNESKGLIKSIENFYPFG